MVPLISLNFFTILHHLISELSPLFCSLSSEPTLSVVLFILHKYTNSGSLNPLFLTKMDRREQEGEQGGVTQWKLRGKGGKNDPSEAQIYLS